MTGRSMMMLLPPAEGLCQTCARDHAPEQPHDRQTLYYGAAFEMLHGRTPTWADAMAHCAPEMQVAWRSALEERGVDVGEPMGGAPWSEAVRRLLAWMGAA